MKSMIKRWRALRMPLLILATTALLRFVATPSTAEATTISIVSTVTSSGAPLDQLAVGDTVTVGLRIVDSVAVVSIGASVSGYDESIVDFEQGITVGSINHTTCIPSLGCFGGLDNTAAPNLIETDLGPGPRVQFFNGTRLVPGSSANPLDPGLDGVLGGGDAQVRITFIATGLGSTTLDFGTGYLGDLVLLADSTITSAVGAQVHLTVIPEPGTALLILLGLAGMSGLRPRSSGLMERLDASDGDRLPNQ